MFLSLPHHPSRAMAIAGARRYIGPMTSTSSRLDQFLAAVAEAATAGTLVRIALRMPFGPDETLRSIDIRPVLLKSGARLAFTHHHRTRDLQQNHELPEALDLLRAALTESFRQGFAFAESFDLSYDAQGKTPKLKRSAPTSKAPAAAEHDRSKARAVPADRPWLAELGVTDAKGEVLKTAGDKFRQINRYVEILGPLLDAIPKSRLNRVVDMGAGKGYLTFAVADHLAAAGREAEVVGVEYRKDLTELCNAIATRAGLAHLSFTPGAIADYDATGASVLIALHACDTATDDAIAKGIAAEADLIVVAPCCHKQIRREMEAGEGQGALTALTRHGIFLERQAEMVTDAMRALILEYFGYQVKVFEFISDLHTPKNVLIVASRTSRDRNPAALDRLNESKTFFGVRRHYLETATGLPVSSAR